MAIGDYATGEDADTKNPLRRAITAHLAAQAQRVRMHGSAAIDLVWLAPGRIDAVITHRRRQPALLPQILNLVDQAAAHIP